MVTLSDDRAALQRLADALAADAGSDTDPALLGLLMAARFYPGLDVDGCLAQIDGMAARAAALLGPGRSPARVIAAINTTLFEEEGFSGNVDDYYDPRNSFLNEVLSRRTGIPISLSVVYLAIARRLGKPVVGVGMPLHFIVKYAGRAGEVYVDPFRGGRILTREDCHRQVEQAYGAPVEFHDSYLEAVPSRLILYRMLNNLKFIFLRRQEFDRAGQVVEQMLLVDPDRPEEVRDRGLLYYQTEDWALAARYLTTYLRDNPSASDAESVGKRLQEAHEKRARMN